VTLIVPVHFVSVVIVIVTFPFMLIIPGLADIELVAETAETKGSKSSNMITKETAPKDNFLFNVYSSNL
jgi:hypothetical protein